MTKLDIINLILAFAILIVTIIIFLHLITIYGEMCGSYATMQICLEMLEQLKP